MLSPLLVGAVAAATFGLVGCDQSSAPSRPTTPSESTPSTAASSTAGPVLRRPAPRSVAGLLSRQSSAVRYGDEQAWLSTWADVPAAQRQAHAVWRNLSALQVGSLRARVGAGAPPDSPDQGSDRWHVDVDVTWTQRSDGLTPEPATNRLRYELTQRAGHPVLVAVTAIPGRAEPVWSAGRMVVLRTPRTLVVAPTSAGARHIGALLRAAVRDVQRVLPQWRGGLVAYLPTGTPQFDALVGARPGQYDGIAAVTTTVDGSSRPAAPVAIMLNPSVFAGLGPVGAHVVVTHEATHMATGVAVRPMPPWVAEGFADYVAVGSVHVPITESAARAIHRVRTAGVPTQLPDSAAFDAAPGPLEAVYEEAWLANRLIARTYGQDRLVAFYRAVRARPHEVPSIFQRVLHTSQRLFTASWQRMLVALADR